MNTEFDLIIAGAGPVGCVIAERAATQLGWKCLIVDKRNHIAGNCHDTSHESGVLIHKYGPHYFRTNNSKLLDYLSQFTDWIPGNYIVKSFNRGELFSFPINMDTLEQFFGKELTPDTAKELIDSIREEIPNPKNSEEFVLSRVGRELYEAFYLGYTLKQWDLHPKDLDASVCGRIPIRFNRDNRYVDHEFQVTPAKGFTAMFGKMIDHQNIEVMLDTDYFDLRKNFQAKQATVYCGPVDDYFGRKLGPLPWRSLEFEFKLYKEELKQPCVQINYPNTQEYTRSVEIKHVTRQVHPHTVISYEYPRSHGDPYYPIPASENHSLYKKYEELEQEETRKNRVLFCGRLAQYCYMNTDQAIEAALETFESLRSMVSK